MEKRLYIYFTLMFMAQNTQAMDPPLSYDEDSYEEEALKYINEEGQLLLKVENNKFFIPQQDGPWQELKLFSESERQDFLNELMAKIQFSFFFQNMTPIDPLSRPWINAYLADIAIILGKKDYEFQRDSYIPFHFSFTQTIISPHAMCLWGTYLKNPTCVLTKLGFVATNLNATLLENLVRGLQENKSVEEIYFINNRGNAKDGIAYACAEIIVCNTALHNIKISEEKISFLGAACLAAAFTNAASDSKLQLFSLTKNIELSVSAMKEMISAAHQFNEIRSSRPHSQRLIIYTDIIIPKVLVEETTKNKKNKTKKNIKNK